MKRQLTIIAFLVVCLLTATAQTSNQKAIAHNSALAKKILDKTASVVGRKGGASASFKITNAQTGSTSGTIAIKGKQFYAVTPELTTWYNGTTQWTYVKANDEVNISKPNQTQQIQMNPYTFLTLYKKGYKLSVKNSGTTNYQVTMLAQNAKNASQLIQIIINKKTYVPSQIKIKQHGAWTTINVSNFKAQNQPNSLFVFNKQKYPTAEIIDLR